MALTEVVYFKEIPIKVSFNEYIEISKYYSTQNSKVFINGILDKIVSQFKREDRIQKIGRGLIWFMRNILFILSIINFISCQKIDKGISSSLIESGASITVIGNETIDFGEVTEGEKVDVEYKLKNTGTGDLIISKASASCGCTELQYPEDVIKKGEVDVVKITFDSTGRLGKQIKKITLVSNATPNIKILTLKGKVLPFQN